MVPTGSEDGSRGSSEQNAPTLDERLELLAHRDRRLVLSTLAENGDERLPVGILTDVIAREREDGVNAESVLIDLHHVHLPKLCRADVIEYDPEESLVTYRGDPTLERCLRAVEDAAAD